jgi:hypothetical protein
MSKRSRCSAITTSVDRMTSDPANSRWVFKATVSKSPRSRGFVGYGDADPSNVSSVVRKAKKLIPDNCAVSHDRCGGHAFILRSFGHRA